MTYINRRFSIIGLFLIGIVLLVTYLYCMRWNIKIPILLFWFSISLILLKLVYQILQQHLKKIMRLQINSILIKAKY